MLMAAVIVGMIIYLVSVHKDLVMHDSKIAELADNIQVLQQMLHCCPPPLSKVASSPAHTCPPNVPVAVAAPARALAPAPASASVPAPAAAAAAPAAFASVASSAVLPLIVEADEGGDGDEIVSVGSMELRNMLDIIEGGDEDEEEEDEEDERVSRSEASLEKSGFAALGAVEDVAQERLVSAAQSGMGQTQGLDLCTFNDADLEGLSYKQLKNILRTLHINAKGSRDTLLDRAREFKKTTCSTSTEPLTGT
jgi:hypothetical protein